MNHNQLQPSPVNKIETSGGHIISYIKSFSGTISIGVFFCMALLSLSSQASASSHTKRTLLLELTPAMCALYPSRASTNQCINHYNLTSEGLDLGYRCTSSTTPILSPVQLKVLHRIMPDELYINQAWRRYGACSPYSASGYFRQLSNLNKSLNIPTKINAHNSFVISKKAFIADMKALNPSMLETSLSLTCQKSSMHQPILTKMKVCYESSNFVACPTETEPDSCGKDFIIWGTP